MSDAFALAGVTAVLRRRLLDRFTAADLAGTVGEVPVSAEPPDRVVDEDEPTRVNLYLHQVTPNQGWRNVDLPSTSPDGGRRVGAPPLGLDLHYLLTAYGAEPYVAEILLGHSMLALHEQGVLGPDEIRAALAAGPPPPDPDLPDAVRSSGLADQVESLRVTLEAMDPEAASRLWSAMQARYRMTAAYLVTVVLLEPAAPALPALPVRRVGSAVVTLRRPLLDAVEDDADPAAPILATSTIALLGTSLSGAGVTVRIDEAEAAPPVDAVADSRVTLDLATLAPPLRAGVHRAQVVHTTELGDPPTARPVVESAAVPFLLRPRVTDLDRTNDTVAPVDGVDRAAGTLEVELDPPVTAHQRVLVVLDHLGAGETATLAVPAGNGIVPPGVETDRVAAAYDGVRTGTHLVRVRVDGAESPVTGPPGDPYDQPQVVV